MNHGAFIKAAQKMLDQAFEDAARSLMGLKPKKRVCQRSLRHVLKCIEDHDYVVDAGIGGVKHHYNIGETYQFTDLSAHSLDITKFEYLGAEYI